MATQDQAASLRLVRGQGDATAPRRERAIAVTGGKGGVGKSTVAVGLATAYAIDGARTLLVDGDLGMADLNLLLGVAPSRSLADLLAGAPLEDVLMRAHGIELLPAMNGNFDLATMGAAARARSIELVGELARRHDTLVVDIAAGIGHHQLAFTRAARDVVVVVNPEPLSMADAYACLKVLALRAGLTSAYVVPNRVASRDQAESVVARLCDLVTRFVDLTLVPLPFVPADPAVTEAARDGVPLLHHNPDAPAARALRRIARALDSATTPDHRLRAAQDFWHQQLAVTGGEP
ncbi:MAG: P-loop NTPase [Kofleriaceae bacterium]|jgi:flagellar biosynthesis protein FlhG|nr:P-loop NTPase [Kofleriaceae bacterium]MBP9166759.1 P-loop NTPase [Kofleriaceae bacterium]MBP9857137.1 P-loop NTPase [Kofleriaceae bacterium]